MLSKDQQLEISILENQFKLLTAKINNALKKDLVFWEVKKLLRELKFISSRLDQLKEERIRKEAKSMSVNY